MITINNLNKRLRELRKTLNLTQKEFAATIGLKQTSYSEIENNRSDLTERNKNLICQAFNVNPEWLETGNGDIFLQSDKDLLEEVAKEYGLTDIGKQIVKAYVELPEDKRNAVNDFIKSIFNERENKETKANNYNVPVELPNELTDGLTINELYKKKMEEQEKLKNERPAL